jgi:hypothetical protein
VIPLNGRPVRAVARDRIRSIASEGRAVRPVSLWIAWMAVLPGALWCHAQGPIQLRNVTARTGIDFCHTDGSSGRHYIVEYVASGLATFDYDGDGRIDIYFLNGQPLLGTQVDVPPKNHLYRNLGGWRFEEVTDRAGVGRAGYGLGVAVADYDNDGLPDLYVSNFGPNVLFRNRGDGAFVDVTDQAGVARGDKVGAGVSFLDFDRDGNVDLYVSNYVKFRYELHVPVSSGGRGMYHGPRAYDPEPDQLFRNNGDGTFADVSDSSGIAALAGPGMGMVCGDFDGDGDTDVFVLNDVFRNFYFENDGTGKFREIGVQNGTAYNVYGQENGNMGVDCGDYDNDGRLDLFVTTYQTEPVMLLRNLGTGLFEDVTLRTRAAQGSFNQVKWGCGFVDFDNDGHKDIFMALGHLQDFVEHFDDTTSYDAAPVLLRNTGRGTFVNVSDSSGDGLRARSVGRGAAFDDLDNDGRVDVVILNSRRPPTVLRNESPGGNHWVQVRLRGVKTNRGGVGAQVRVVAQDLAQIAEVHSGRGYQSDFGARLHFGLGSRTTIDRIEVRWLGGGTEVWENVAVDQMVVLTEGTSQKGPPGRESQGGRNDRVNTDASATQ